MLLLTREAIAKRVWSSSNWKLELPPVDCKAFFLFFYSEHFYVFCIRFLTEQFAVYTTENVLTGYVQPLLSARFVFQMGLLCLPVRHIETPLVFQICVSKQTYTFCQMCPAVFGLYQCFRWTCLCCKSDQCSFLFLCFFLLLFFCQPSQAVN